MPWWTGRASVGHSRFTPTAYHHGQRQDNGGGRLSSLLLRHRRGAGWKACHHQGLLGKIHHASSATASPLSPSVAPCPASPESGRVRRSPANATYELSCVVWSRIS